MAETVPVPTSEAPLTEDSSQTEETLSEAASEEELALDEEFEEELIIEDFTIDGICGVY